ncbi:variant erythrocyte surface antigen-1 family protein [Babesia caballi]|uniref:Variant erythrocyte surface antigen-1 family protein n=1 Tax=Babesia caballi TaxID=5871 RepID=A0AAV4M031_BABCB|nr:variant erythrocyte surface antigen-1 family protein [Babesia caballi]
MTAPEKKSLTQAPTNLKEAIDWVLRVSGGDQGSVPYPMNFVKTLHLILNTIPHTEDDFRSKALKEIKIDENAFQKGFIYRLAEGLQKFIGYEFKYEKPNYKISIGYNGVVNPGELYTKSKGQSELQPSGQMAYTTAYTGSKWEEAYRNVDNPSELTVQNFFTAVQIIFESLTELYLKCKKDWASTSLGGTGGTHLKQFMKKNGFSGTQLNTDMKGERIISQALKSFKEFDTAHNSAGSNPSLDAFRSHLEQNGMSNPSNYPLSALYILATCPLSALIDLPSDCPSNLKEAIDWILRVTGKDGQSGDSDGTQQLASAVSKLLGDVGSSEPELHKKLGAITQALKSDATNGIINALGEGLNKFKEGIKSMNYKSAYESLEWGTFFQDAPTASTGSKTPPEVGAKIFLGCVPMIFSALSYLYWRCDKGGWKTLKLNDRDGSALKNFMESVGFDPDKHLDQSKNGEEVVTAFQIFEVFSKALPQTNEKGFTGFLSALLKNVPTHSASFTPGKAFVGLHIAAQAYFAHKRSTNPKASPNPPSSIRTMLYWLSGLTITAQFGELLDHINSIFPSGPISVAISGSPQTGETLSADDVAGHLVESCVTASRVLSTIQGRSVSGNPLLHDIYCSSDFSYPSSGRALFNALSNYTYALQFQLHFLHRQCSRVSTYGSRWRQCKYGQSINTHSMGQIVESHICPVKCNQQDHNNSNRHPRKCKHDNCGQESSKASPLQAFLTDNLRGFYITQQSVPESLNHLENHPPGAMCHVKMGFQAKNLRKDPGTGGNIYRTLEPFCGSPTSSLRQLCEELQCLVKRAPRDLGDIFGFYLQLVGQLFNARMTLKALSGTVLTSLDVSDEFETIAINLYPSLKGSYDQIKSHKHPPVPSGLSRSLKTISKNLPFWFQLFMVDDSRDMAGALFDLRQHCHNQNGVSDTSKHYDPSGEACAHTTDNAADLWSLYYPQCTGQNYCGKYLFPLCHSIGSTFAPKFAVTYLSWVLYLGDDLQSGFRQMLDDFNDIKCTSHLETSHRSGCSCSSVVHCSGVLPLFYTNGFRFTDAEALNGWTYDSTRSQAWQYNPGNVKTCANFHSQLSNVLSEGAPLHNLLLAIDEFLYYVRFRFMSMVSSFWLCSLAILLYFIFYGIDVLHLQSHAHFPSSHIMPPIGLLTTGKGPALTKLTYYMP